MFDLIGAPRHSGPSTGEVLRAALRSRVLQAAAALLAVVLITLALYVSWLHRLAWSEECETWPDVDPTMADLLSLRGRLHAYQRTPAPEAELALTGEEVTFMFGERTNFRMQAQFVGDLTLARVAVPSEGGCYNVDFRGEVAGRNGLVMVTPEHLVVGGADITRWVGGRSLRLNADRVPDERAARMLANTRDLRVESGQLMVRLKNSWDVW
ncbi:MAG: hypothetical protein JRJ84_13225 [Deltaproteobacteria bacterium]|nr:hypothetical protein [Deltaproteobacteria bacterium]